MTMQLQVAGRTETGPVRDNNEDAIVANERLLAVADGMGGHQAGEVASALSVLTVEGFLLNTLKRFFHMQVPEEQHVLKEFQEALLQADARIFEEASRHRWLLVLGHEIDQPAGYVDEAGEWEPEPELNEPAGLMG